MSKIKITCYEEAVNYLYKIPKFAKKNVPDDTKDFLKLLGNPDQNMKIIHVAGTNGKGSVCAYLQGILEEAGFTCAIFTSPHLVDIRERFLLNHKMVSKEQFLDAFLKVYDLIGDQRIKEGYHPSFFEYLFFMAMLLFSDENRDCITDYVILETGLGGRLDATNSVSKKEICIITKIGLDHMEYLGQTKALIAGEKAGILKAGVPVVFLSDLSEIDDVIWKKAKENKSPCFTLSKKDYTFLNFKNKTIDFSYYSRYYDYISLCLHTTALYQMQNASLAVLAAEVLLGPKRLTKEQIQYGIEKTKWAGRMEEIAPNIYIDGAHNEDGIEAFTKSVEIDQCAGERFLIFSAVYDKQYDKMISILLESGLFKHIIFTKINNDRALSKEILMQIIQQYPQYDVVWQDDCMTALQTAVQQKNEMDFVYMAGSLYLVGEVKQKIE